MIVIRMITNMPGLLARISNEIRKKPIYRVQSQESALDHNHQANSGNQPRDWMLEERGTLV